MENIKFAEVIPLLKLPKSLEIFDYRIPEHLSCDIQTGQIIEMPFRKKNISGLVVRLKTKVNIQNSKIKNVIKIKEKKFLSSHQLDLACWMSQYYYQSLPLILKSIIPAIPKKIYQKNNLRNEKTFLEKIPDVMVDDILSESKQYILLSGNYPQNAYEQLISASIKNNKQALLLFPETALAQKMHNRYARYFNEDSMGIITGALSKNSFYALWKKILHNEIKIIIGTRRAVFAPFSNLGLIIMDGEEAKSFKQWDQNPRYNARDVAIKLSELTGSKLILASIAPSVTTYSKIYKKFHYVFFPWKDKNIEIINPKNEPKNHPPSDISKHVLQILNDLRGQAIIMINRKGMASSVICKNCGYVFLCEKCHIPFTRYKNRHNELICHNCNNNTNLPEKCPICKGMNYYFSGPGTRKIAEDIQTFFPNYTTCVIDSDTSMAEKNLIIKNFENTSVKILIATQAIFNDLFLHKEIDSIAIISADILFNKPEYFSEELAWQFLIKCISLAKKTIIQTYNPDNPVIQCAKKLQFDAWYSAELNNRKQFKYPPFSKIIKIVFQYKNREKANTEAIKIARNLKNIILENNLAAELHGPIEPYAIITRGNYRVNLILKIFKKEEKVENLIKIIPDKCLIDVDPVSIL